jgi:cyclophilin family peptidyl-prolyl cis-trans isomerase
VLDDSGHIIVGEVVDGLHLLRKIRNQSLNEEGDVVALVKIEDCGELPSLENKSQSNKKQHQ